MAAQPHGEPSAVTEVPAAVCGSPSPQELLVFVFLELCCKPPALSSAHAVPALTPALGGLEEGSGVDEVVGGASPAPQRTWWIP